MLDDGDERVRDLDRPARDRQADMAGRELDPQRPFRRRSFADIPGIVAIGHPASVAERSRRSAPARPMFDRAAQLFAITAENPSVLLWCIRNRGDEVAAHVRAFVG